MGDDVFMDEEEVDGGTNSVSPRPSLASDRRDYMSLAAVPRLSRPSVEIKVPPCPSRPKAWHRPGSAGLSGFCFGGGGGLL